MEESTLDVTPIPDWMTTAQVMARTGKSARYVQNLGHKGVLRSKKANRPELASNALLYSGEDLKKYLDLQERKELSASPEAVRRREARQKQKAPLAVIGGMRYKSLTLVLRSEAGSTRAVLGNPDRNLMLGNKVTASLVRLHEYAMPLPGNEAEADAEGGK